MTDDELTPDQIRELHATLRRIHDEYDDRLSGRTMGKSALLTYQCRRRGCELLHVFRLPWHAGLIVARPPTRSSPNYSWWIPSREVMDRVADTRDFVGTIREAGMRTGYPVRDQPSRICQWEEDVPDVSPRVECHHLPRTKIPARQIAHDLSDRTRQGNRVRLPLTD
ncbi:hypothetical protein CEY15_02270 [Dietzia natronolimnaea]|uniref:Uncharacterized protein n=1 Tax=Dietzia natronolimnaea TaxID=161920 RepID=A0A2A2WTU1_9ACTN|nr:hypothetical protein [Dietzia natronolimnaea]PAY24642.1 hypothetical protein CEY15_02270 [Dietzia natronolimnaea]